MMPVSPPAVIASSRTAGSQKRRGQRRRTAGGSFKRLTIALGLGFFVAISGFSSTHGTRDLSTSIFRGERSHTKASTVRAMGSLGRLIGNYSATAAHE